MFPILIYMLVTSFFVVIDHTCTSKLLVGSLQHPGLASHPILNEDSVEILHHALILHHNKQVTVGFLPCRIRIGW